MFARSWLRISGTTCEEMKIIKWQIISLFLNEGLGRNWTLDLRIPRSYALTTEPQRLLARCGVSVAQWLEHRSAESEGLRFDFSWGLRNFCLSHARDKTEKHLSVLKTSHRFKRSASKSLSLLIFTIWILRAKLQSGSPNSNVDFQGHFRPPNICVS